MKTKIPKAEQSVTMECTTKEGATPVKAGVSVEETQENRHISAKEKLRVQKVSMKVRCFLCQKNRKRGKYSKKQWKRATLRGDEASCMDCMKKKHFKSSADVIPLVSKAKPVNKVTSPSFGSEGESKEGAESKVDIDLSHDCVYQGPWQLDPKLMEDQPTINVLAGGHVSHGKSSLMTALSGKQMMQHSDEKKGSKTINLGYMSFKIYRCKWCPPPENYHPLPGNTKSGPDLVCKHCDSPMTLLRHLAFLDAPGHFEYFFTMLSGITTVDAMMLVAAANTGIEPQTVLHTNAAYLLDTPINNLVVAQNKVDLLYPDRVYQAGDHVLKLKHFMRSYGVPRPCVVPCSATMNLGLGGLMDALVNQVKPSDVDLTLPPRGRIVRSFDVNEGGMDVMDMKGGVLGCIVKWGLLKKGMTLEIRPGAIFKDGKVMPIFCHVRRLQTERRSLDVVHPGCSVGIGTSLDPCLTKKNNLVGHTIGLPGTLPPVFKMCVVSIVKIPPGVARKKFKAREKIFVIAGSVRKAVVKHVKNSGKGDNEKIILGMEFEEPVCASEGETFLILRGNRAEMQLYASVKVDKIKPMELLQDDAYTVGLQQIGIENGSEVGSDNSS